MSGPLLETLDGWRQAGWLRHLDVSLARFIGQTDPGAPPSLLLAAALVSHQEGGGHTGLALDALSEDPAGTLGWPDAAAQALKPLLAEPWPVDDDTRRAAWSRQASVAIEPTDDRGASPLVLDGSLLQLRRHWRAEATVARTVMARARLSADGSTGSGTHSPAQGEAARALLDRLFPTAVADAASPQDTSPAGPGASPGQPGPDWQRHACEVALRGRLTVVTGGPGTGKTYTAARMLVALQALREGPEPLRVALAAPTGKAAARLRQSISQALQALQETPGDPFDLASWAERLGPGKTLHALLGTQPGTRRFRHDAARPLAVDVLVVDEASMVHLELMAQLLDALPPHARLVLLVDKDQLASVEAGAVMGALCLHAADAATDLTEADSAPSPLARQTVALRRSRRFDGPIGELARRVNTGDAPGALALLRSDTASSASIVAATAPPVAVAWAARGYRAHVDRLGRRAALDGASAFEPWVREMLTGFDAFRTLCVVRDGPWGVNGLNRAIERALAGMGLPVQDSEWYEGRPVMVQRNDAALGLFNGDIGIVLRGPAGDRALRAWFADGEALRSIPVGRLPQVETAFAMTVHKSQGSEFGHVALVLPDADVPILTRELLYTGITRSRASFTLLAKDEALLLQAIRRPTRRDSGLQRQLARWMTADREALSRPVVGS
jgi:exodeoxyribonuclease V alpha subunit